MKKLLLSLVALLTLTFSANAQTVVSFADGLPSDWTKVSGTVAKATRVSIGCLQLQKNTAITSPVISNLSEFTISLNISSPSTLKVEKTIDGGENWTTLRTIQRSECDKNKFVDFEISSGETSGNVQIKLTCATSSYYISTFTYSVNDSGKQPCGLSLTPADAAYTVNLGETFTAPALSNPNGLAVTWTSSKPEVASVDASTGAVTLGTVADTTRITATTEGDETYDGGSVYYDLTVVDPNAPGTVNNPYTVAQALEACAFKPVGVYAKGVVVSVKTAWTGTKTDYYIADSADAAAVDQLYVYAGKWDAACANKPSDSKLEVGATVIVKGDLTIFGSNSVKEFNSGSTIVSYTAPAPVIKPLGDITMSYGEVADEVIADEKELTGVAANTTFTFKGVNATKMTVSNIEDVIVKTEESDVITYTVGVDTEMFTVTAYGVDADGNDTSASVLVSAEVVKPVLGELVVKYGDTTVAADGDVTVEEGTAFTLSAENATSIKVSYGDDVEETFTTLPATWKPAVHAEGIATVTATLGTDTKELMFFLTVTERQATETEFEEAVVNIDPTAIGMGGSGYNMYFYELEGTDLQFVVKANNNKGMQINTENGSLGADGTATENSYMSGIVSTVNDLDGVIEKIVLTDVTKNSTASLFMKMGNVANGYTIEKTGETEYNMKKSYLNIASGNNAVITPVINGGTYTYTMPEDAEYTHFAITSKGACYIGGVQVYYKGCPKVNLTMDQTDVIDGATFSKETSAVMNFNVRSEGDVKVYYRLNMNPDTPAENALARAGEVNPFTLHQGEDITIDDRHSSVEYYAQKGLYKTPVRTIYFDVTTGVEAIGAEAGEAVYFDLQGNRVAAPETGVYIKVVGGRASKVLF